MCRFLASMKMLVSPQGSNTRSQIIMVIIIDYPQVTL